MPTKGLGRPPNRRPSMPSRSVGPWFALAVILMGTVLGTFNNGVGNVALPDVLSHFDVAVSAGAWFVTAYVLALAVTLPIAGRLIDTFGTRAVSIAGLVGFLAASLVVATSSNYVVLVIGRAAQGAFNAPVLPTIMVSVVTLFGPAERGKAMGVWVAVNGASFAVSPVVAGFVVESMSWHAIFWVSIAVTVLALVLSALYMPDVSATRAKEGFDAAGGLLLAGGLVGIMAALSRVTAWGWLSPLTLGLLIGGLAALAVAVHRSGTVPDPFLDLTVLRQRAYATPTAIAGLQALVLFGLLLILPLMYLHVFDLSLGVTGVLVFVLPGTWALVSPAVGHAADRFGRGTVLRWGTIALVAGTLVLGGGAYAQVLAVTILGMLGIGVAVAAIQATAAVAVSEAVGSSGRGTMTGAFHTARFFAGVVGATLFAVLIEVVAGTGDLERATSEQLASAFVAVFVVAVVTSVAAVGLSFRSLGQVDLRPLGPEPNA